MYTYIYIIILCSIFKSFNGKFHCNPYTHSAIQGKNAVCANIKQNTSI